MSSRGRTWRSNYILKRANQFMATSRYEEAMIFLTEAVHREPTLAEAHFSKGVCRLKMELYNQDTIDCFDCALSLRSDYANALYNRALCRHKIVFRNMKISGVTKDLGLQDKALLHIAINDYSAAIRIDRFFSECYSNRASCYGTLRDSRRAAADLNKAAQCMDSTSDLHKLYKELMIAKEQAELGSSGSGSFGEEAEDSDAAPQEESLWERRRRQRLVRLRRKSIEGKDELIQIYKNRQKVLNKLGSTEEAKQDGDRVRSMTTEK
jgi:tetratricopeptide (TPR) repeat protein